MLWNTTPARSAVLVGTRSGVGRSGGLVLVPRPVGASTYGHSRYPAESPSQQGQAQGLHIRPTPLLVPTVRSGQHFQVRLVRLSGNLFLRIILQYPLPSLLSKCNIKFRVIQQLAYACRQLLGVAFGEDQP